MIVEQSEYIASISPNPAAQQPSIATLKQQVSRVTDPALPLTTPASTSRVRLPTVFPPRGCGIFGGMDVERTMQFILNSQAKAEARFDKADALADRADARMDKMEKRTEREMNAIRKLLQQGMKSLTELTEAQKETDRVLRAFIKSSRNGGSRRNGEDGH